MRTVDAKAIRKKRDVTKDGMATALGPSPSGYKGWEQETWQPSGGTHALIHVMDREPEAVLRALFQKDGDTAPPNQAASH